MYFDKEQKLYSIVPTELYFDIEAHTHVYAQFSFGGSCNFSYY